MLPEVFRTRIIDSMLEGVPVDEQHEYAGREITSTDPATVLQATRAVIHFSSRD